MSVKVTGTDEQIHVQSPYNEDFINQARQLGGTWNRGQKIWEFALPDEGRVRQALREIYGTDGTPTPHVDLHIRLDELGRLGSELAIGGRVVLRKWNRDTTPKVGSDCAVIAGALKASGGSRNNPRITFEDGTIVEARNIPKPLAERLVEENPDVYVIVNANEANGAELTPEEKSLLATLQALDENRLQLLLTKLEQ